MKELPEMNAAISPTQSPPVHTGSCLCGGVRFEVSGALRDVVECHCAMCRKTHGHVAAYTAAPHAALRFASERTLAWYDSSPVARRGFCNTCGASLFWQRAAADVISIAAGTLDKPTGLQTTLQIFVDDAGDYYTIRRDVPRRVE
ncbi:MAG: GFA family protein [Casimicrobiaceae bacterium]